MLSSVTLYLAVVWKNLYKFINSLIAPDLIQERGEDFIIETEVET